jgi:hypothetical protein
MCCSGYSLLLSANVLKGRVSPDYGAECDHLSIVSELPDTEISDEVNIQNHGSVDRNAANDINVDVMYVKRGLQVGDPTPRPKPHPDDPRSLQKCDVSALVKQVISLSEPQQKELYETLIKYMDHMTTKPGRCNLLDYKFQVNTDKPIVGYSRPIPFTLRPAVREQINQMLKDGILETSSSPILNPLTVVSKE